MLADVRKQTSNYVADRRADTQRNIKDSDELECRQWRPPVSAARHSSFMKKEVVLPHRIKVPRLIVNVTCAWGASSTRQSDARLAACCSHGEHQRVVCSFRSPQASPEIFATAFVAGNPHQFSAMIAHVSEPKCALSWVSGHCACDAKVL
jgi:hypothetical protein